MRSLLPEPKKKTSNNNVPYPVARRHIIWRRAFLMENNI